MSAPRKPQEGSGVLPGPSALDVAVATAEAASPAGRKATVNAVAELLERSGIDVADVGRVQKINLWQGFYKDNDGESQKVDLTGVVLSPSWEDGPAWPLVQPGAPRVPRKPAPAARVRSKRDRVAVILPDPQIGFRRDLEDPALLDPFHDEAAISVALAVVRDLDPDRVVNLGDTLDFPEFGRFTQEAGFQMVAQPTLDRGTEYACQQREAAPNAQIDWLEGNHDKRLALAILSNAKAAFGLRQGRDPRTGRDVPVGWPVMSIPHLLRLDDFGVNYVGAYPAGELWLNDRLLCVHGERLKADRVLQDEQVSVIQGHTHRAEVAYRRRRLRSGSWQTFAASPGCLCRIDGAVPSVHSGFSARGGAVQRQENWQQGIAIVHYRDGDSPVDIDVRPIVDGTVRVGGRLYTASQRSTP